MPPEPTANRPRIILAGARAVYIGPGLALSPHRNAVATLAIAWGAPFEIGLPDRASETRAVALIPANTLHHLRAAGPMIFLYLDALADDQRMIAALVDHPDARERIATQCAQIAGQGDAAGIIRSLLTLMGLSDDPAEGPIAATVRAIDKRPNDFASAKVAADFAGLSESQFHRAIRRATGVPFRRYRLWRRLAMAATALTNGANLTQAAMDGGFASSAHFSATFRRMFGIKPSLLIQTRARFDIIHSACVASALP